MVVYKGAKRGRAASASEPFTPALCTGHRQQDSLSHPTKGPRFDFAPPTRRIYVADVAPSTPRQSNQTCQNHPDRNLHACSRHESTLLRYIGALSLHSLLGAV
jgi:hypothetical protein